MRGSEEKSTPDVLDSAQLVRIEAVHRDSFISTCMPLAAVQSQRGVTVTVELDEDIDELQAGAHLRSG